MTRFLVDTQIPWVSRRSILCPPAKERGHRVHEMVGSSAVEHISNELAMHGKATASNWQGKTGQVMVQE